MYGSQSGQAMRRVPMYMSDWIEKLHGFLQLNDRDILNDAGKVSHELAAAKAETEKSYFMIFTPFVNEEKTTTPSQNPPITIVTEEKAKITSIKLMIASKI